MKQSILDSQIKIYGYPRKLDVVLLHAPFCWEGHCTKEQNSYNWLDGWRNLEQLHQEGLISAIGVSNVNEHELNDLLAIANVRVSVVQNWMDPFHQDKKVRLICRNRNIAYMAYSTLGNQWYHMRNVGRNPVFTDPVLRSIAESRNTSVSTVALSWALQEGVVIIPKSGKTKHIIDNSKLLVNGTLALELTNAELMQIRSLDN
jgi:diketogulonate reductase-like aldo/keto reductase